MRMIEGSEQFVRKGRFVVGAPTKNGLLYHAIMMTRRHVLAIPAALAAAPKSLDVAAIDRARILESSARYLREEPFTITAASSPRSAGGKHDFFSEGDYWWPDPANRDGPYIQRDGMTNPDNFVAHRHAMIRLSVQVPALVAAWRITKDKRYADHAVRHLKAWFEDPDTRMNPHLLYAQAIHGRFTGRGIGIIDTLHLCEVARAAGVLEASTAFPSATRKAVRQWFRDYLSWMTTHRYGTNERDAKNNHGTCWVLQVAVFAQFNGNLELTRFCRERYKNVLLPTQAAIDGSFPLELARTKPYGYSLFNLDAMAMICQVLSTRKDNLWAFALPDGRGIGKAMEFMFPYIANKKTWPYKQDVMYFDEWPVRHPSLLFAGIALERPAYIDLWRRLNPDVVVDEVVRNYPIRQPLLWI